MARAAHRATLALMVAALSATAASRADAAPSPTLARPLTGFLSSPMEQLAVPGDLAAGELTPEGDVYTGWAEYEPLVGSRLVSFDQPTRIAPDPSMPLYVAQMRQGSVSYVERSFAVGLGGQPVVELTMTAVNRSARPRPARVGMQIEYTRGAQIPTFFPGAPASPYRFPRGLGGPAGLAGDGRDITDPGVAFDPAWVYAVDGRDIIRDGLLLVRGPDAPGRPLPPAADVAATPTTPQAGTDYAATLGGHATASWTWQIPLAPPVATPAVDASLDAADPVQASAQFARGWRSAQTGEMRVSLPEPRIDDVFEDSVVDILAARDRILGSPDWFQAVNKFQYQGFWLRDSSIMTVALDEVGLHAAAGQNLSSLPDWQQPDGEYLSQAGQQDGVGEALWEIDEHAVLADDTAYAAASIAPVSQAVAWLTQACATEVDGLLPAVSVDDNEDLTDAQITGNDIWAAVGLRSAVSLAQLADRPDLVAAWTATDRRFEAHLDAALAADQRRFGHVTPAIGEPGGNDWGNYQLAYPMAIVRPRGVEVSSMIAWEQAHSSQGLAEYAHPGELHDYLGFPVFEAELRRGGPGVAAAIDGLYAETTHTTASGEGWEDGPRAFQSRASTANLAPHGTFAAQYVSLVHNLLVDDTGGGIDLLAGAAPAWLAPGDHVAVTGAATDDGPVSLRLSASDVGATLHWSLRRFPGAAEPLYWTLPYWVSAAHRVSGALVRGALRLRGDGGTIALLWSARRPAQSLSAAIAGLDGSYTQRGVAAPLTPAPDW